MTDKDSVLQLLCAALRTEGLLLRGGFHPEPDDDAPPGTATLLLFGKSGPEMWHAFEKGRRRGTDPLNDWTRRVLSGVADRFGAAAIFPFDGPPYAPFFGWARQAEAVSESPIGMMIHPAYGLWYAWRRALAFREKLAVPEFERVPMPCDGCNDKPCRTACPVDAFRDGTYDVAACAAHLRMEAGADCMALGCQARRACPIGSGHIYAPAQARFHMRAFLRNQPP